MSFPVQGVLIPGLKANQSGKWRVPVRQPEGSIQVTGNALDLWVTCGGRSVPGEGQTGIC